MRFLVRCRLDGSPCVPYGAVLEVLQKGSATWGAGACPHYSACKCALERLPVRTVRHTVASHDMQHIDLCEADSMLADNVALELLLQQHEA